MKIRASLTALVLVTDGVVEAPDVPLDEGLKRTGSLAAQALRNGLRTPNKVRG
jgi:hypothetical protein